MIFLADALVALNVVVQAILLVFLLGGPVRQQFVLLIYSIAQLVFAIPVAFAMLTTGVESVFYRNVYWTADVVLDLLRFFMVIVITQRVMVGSPLRPAVGRLLFTTCVAVIVLPFVLFHPFFSSRWFRHTSQLLSFGGAFMNLCLWTAIIGKRDRDPQLLWVSAGLGVAATGVAATYGLLQFTSVDLRWLPDTFKSMTLLTGTVIWCWAFRPATRVGIIQHEAVSPVPETLALATDSETRESGVTGSN